MIQQCLTVWGLSKRSFTWNGHWGNQQKMTAHWHLVPKGKLITHPHASILFLLVIFIFMGRMVLPQSPQAQISIS